MAEAANVECGKQLYDWAYNEMHFYPEGKFANTKPPTEEEFIEFSLFLLSHFFNLTHTHVTGTFL